MARGARQAAVHVVSKRVGHYLVIKEQQQQQSRYNLKIATEKIFICRSKCVPSFISSVSQLQSQSVSQLQSQSLYPDNDK